MATTRKIIDILTMPTSHFSGFLPAHSRESLVYTKNGVRIHTIQIDHPLKNWAKTQFKRAEFVDVLGNVTDEFWGNINDFNDWFVGKAARGEQFFVVFFNRDGPAVELRRVIGYRGWIGSPHDKISEASKQFYQADDMTWRLV